MPVYSSFSSASAARLRAASASAARMRAVASAVSSAWRAISWRAKSCSARRASAAAFSAATAAARASASAWSAWARYSRSSSCTSRSPCFTHWLSATARRTTRPATWALMRTMRPSMNASSVETRPEARHHQAPAARATTISASLNQR